MKDIRNIMLGLGFIYPLTLLAAYLILIWEKNNPPSDTIMLCIVFLLCIIGMLLAISLSRNLPEKYLIFGGVSGYIIFITIAAIYAYKATRPIDWRKSLNIPAQSSNSYHPEKQK